MFDDAVLTSGFDIGFPGHSNMFPELRELFRVSLVLNLKLAGKVSNTVSKSILDADFFVCIFIRKRNRDSMSRFFNSILEA